MRIKKLIQTLKPISKIIEQALDKQPEIKLSDIAAMVTRQETSSE